MKLVLILTALNDDQDEKEFLDRFPCQGATFCRTLANPPADFESLSWMRLASNIGARAIESAYIEKITPGPHGLAGKERKDAR